MNFEFATATRIIFGDGRRHELQAIVPKLGRRALVVQGQDKDRRLEWLRNLLAECRIDYSTVHVPSEPDISLVEAGAREARQRNCEFVIGVGGGSSIDAGKAIAALATNTLPTLDYLEVIGHGKPLTKASLPFIAIPTTAGTGAEVTRNAVLSSKEHQLKVSMRSPYMLPAIALVDPELTYGLPPEITAYTGLDALTQLIEPFLCVKANPLTDALCREALPRVARNLPLAFRDGTHSHARREMALGSLLGGMALANAGLGAVHGFAAPIGGMFQAPHGAICAALLPGAMSVNLRAVQQRKPDRIRRFDELAQLLTGSPTARAADAMNWVEDLSRGLMISGLARYGVTGSSIESLSEKAKAASSMKANPVELTREELHEILQRAL